MKAPSVWAALGLALLGGHPAPAADDTWESVDRIVAVGDVHGDYPRVLEVLEAAGLVDAKARWVGGKAHLVQTGDRIDRGPDSRQVMDLFMRLEKEARKAGGAVHSLIGNHEAMNVLGDLHDVAPEDFAAYATPDSARLRDELLARVSGLRRKEKKPPFTADERSAWEKEHPLGYVEQRLAFLPDGVYGAWIARQNAVIRIGETLFMHGGWSPKYADFSLRDLNDRIRQEMREADPTRALISRDPLGPLWFRGLAHGEPGLADPLAALLKRHGCRRLVVGHTPTQGLIWPRYDGMLIQIDVGLPRFFGGSPAALVIEGGSLFALHRGRRLALPQEPGEALLRYALEVAALEPPRSKARSFVESLPESLKATPSPP